MTHPLDVSRGLLHGVEQMSLESGGRLQRTTHPGGLCNRRDSAVDLSCGFEFSLRWAVAAELADHLEVRPHQNACIKLVCTVDDSTQIVDGSLAARGIS